MADTKYSQEAVDHVVSACDTLIEHLNRISGDVDGLADTVAPSAWGSSSDGKKIDQKLRDYTTTGCKSDGLKSSAEEQKKTIEGYKKLLRSGAQSFDTVDEKSAHGVQQAIPDGGSGKGSDAGASPSDKKDKKQEQSAGGGQGAGSGGGAGQGAGAGGGQGSGAGSGGGAGQGAGGGAGQGMQGAMQGAQQGMQSAMQGAQQGMQGAQQAAQQGMQGAQQAAQQLAGLAHGGDHAGGAAAAKEAAAEGHGVGDHKDGRGDHDGDGHSRDDRGTDHGDDVAEGLHERHRDDKPKGAEAAARLDDSSGTDDGPGAGSPAAATLTGPQGGGSVLPVAEHAPAEHAAAATAPEAGSAQPAPAQPASAPASASSGAHHSGFEQAPAATSAEAAPAAPAQHEGYRGLTWGDRSIPAGDSTSWQPAQAGMLAMTEQPTGGPPPSAPTSPVPTLGEQFQAGSDVPNTPLSGAHPASSEVTVPAPNPSPPPSPDSAAPGIGEQFQEGSGVSPPPQPNAPSGLAERARQLDLNQGGVQE